MTNQTQNNNLNYLIDPTFTKVNRLFVLSFENEDDRRSFSKYYVPNIQIKDFNVLIDGDSFFDMPIKNEEETHLATRRRCDVLTTSLCTSQRRSSYTSNEKPNDVSVERRRDVSVVCLHDILLQRRDDVSRGLYNNLPLVRLLDVSNKSQMKHPTTSQWYATKTSHILDDSLVRCYDVCCKSQMKHST